MSDPGIRLVMNIPASRLDVVEADRLTHSYLVSGSRGFQTPAGNYGVLIEALEKQRVNVRALGKAPLDRLTRVRNATRLRISLDTLINGADPLER